MRAGILFDVDGTLVDTNYLHVLAWWRALRGHGMQVEMARLHRLMGMGSDKLLERVAGRESEALNEAHSQEYARLSGETAAFPDAGRLLRKVHSRGARVVLATSAQPAELATIRRALDADEVIDEVVTSGDAKESKPAPDIFGVAMERAGLDPEATIVVGDTRWDVEAAGRLGLACVGVMSGGIAAAELHQAGAAAVYEDVAELLRKLAESPLADVIRRGRESRG